MATAYKPFKFPKYKVGSTAQYKPKWKKINASLAKSQYSYKPKKTKSVINGGVLGQRRATSGLSPTEAMILQFMQDYQAKEMKKKDSPSAQGLIGNVLGDVKDLGLGSGKAGLGLLGYAKDIALNQGNHDIAHDTANLGRAIGQDYRTRYGDVNWGGFLESNPVTGIPMLTKNLLQGDSFSKAIGKANPLSAAQNFYLKSNWHKTARKMYDHPVPYILDAASLAAGAGALANAGGKAAAIGRLATANKVLASAAEGTAEHANALKAVATARKAYESAAHGPEHQVFLKGSKTPTTIRLSKNPVTAMRQKYFLAAIGKSPDTLLKIPVLKNLHINTSVGKKSAALQNKLTERAATNLRLTENRAWKGLRDAPMQAAFRAITETVHPLDYLKKVEDASPGLMTAKEIQAFKDAAPIYEKWLAHSKTPMSKMPKEIRKLEEFRQQWNIATHDMAQQMGLDDYVVAQRNWAPQRFQHDASTFEEFEQHNPLGPHDPADSGAVGHYRVQRDLIRGLKLDSKGRPLPIEEGPAAFGGGKSYRSGGKFISPPRPDLVHAADLLKKGAVTFVRVIKHDKDHATAQFVDWKGDVIHTVENIDPAHFNGSAMLKRSEIHKYFQNNQIKNLRKLNGGRDPNYFRHQAFSQPLATLHPKVAGDAPIAGGKQAQFKGKLMEKGIAQNDLTHTLKNMERVIRNNGLSQSIDEFYRIGREVKDKADLRPDEVLLPADPATLKEFVLGSRKMHNEEAALSEDIAREDVEASIRKASEQSEATGGHMVAVPRDLVKRHLAANGFMTNKVPQIIRTYTNVWKHGVLSLRPAFVVNNWVGNQIMATLTHPKIPLEQAYNSIHDILNRADSKYGKYDLMVQKNFSEATVGIGKTERLKPRSFGGGIKTPVDAFFGALEMGYKAVTLHENSLRKAIITGMVKNDPEIKALTKNGMSLDKAVEELKKNNPDSFQQLHDAVVRHTDQIMGDYRYYGPLEQQMKLLIPFYGWYRHLMKYQKALIDEHPISLQVQMQLGTQGAKQREMSFPQFMEAYVPLKSNNPLVAWAGMEAGRKAYIDTHNLNPFATLSDVVDLASGLSNEGNTGLGPLGSLNPMIQSAFEGLTGRDTRTGQTLASEGKTPGLVAAFARPLGNIPPLALGKKAIGSDSTSMHDIITPSGQISTKSPANKMNQNDLRGSILSYLGLPVKRVNPKAAEKFNDTLTAADRGYYAKGIKALEDKQKGIRKKRKKKGELSETEKAQIDNILRLMGGNH